ncbi:MAG TPA: hypothetical protein VK191_13720 [Symbiobacteriaceae bacterium]|nr:hypothetical protein [Symbiobacteriaceae bacterium]
MNSFGIPQFQCFTGTFILQPTGLIGATLGTLITDQGFNLQVRQVPGPNNQGPSLASVNGQRVRLCGTLVTDVSGTLLQVFLVQPLLGF